MNRSLNKMNGIDYGIYVFLIGTALLFVYPFYYIISASFSDPAQVISNPLLLYPIDVTLSAYKLLLSTGTIWLGYYNSILYTVSGTLLNITVTLLAAYALSRQELAGRRIVLFFIVITLFFNGGMIPTYLIVKSLGLLDTRWALIVSGAVTTWNLLITKTYLEMNIPQELRDAAEVDGASELTFFSRIALPLSKPIIAVIALFYGSGHWNAYFNALIYIRQRDLYPLQVYLREMLILDQNTEMMGDVSDHRVLVALTLKFAIMVAAIAPLLIVFPFVQRFFVKGVLIGALKE
ncbi:carbohydrate ABC transporter permease [Paenibacillus radicis (ex Xue et al. 2023)]|uniref:Carbohydrate ABC transporter permease n=1 Tax=Paenibacillus radicis (ex Xue et al. 2023) TaxID=2972489 RepID=A0ABT1YVC4_9BACL|nr:carbohydrate ABC transporter permease [Paenibacillus radicis (ex Xue et al. 2023)]MCR8636877.1 carbohydrate ABC transporter permease [Paenibacillus radicis (ex Xue et al. 2023)]